MLTFTEKYEALRKSINQKLEGLRQAELAILALQAHELRLLMNTHQIDNIVICRMQKGETLTLYQSDGYMLYWMLGENRIDYTSDPEAMNAIELATQAELIERSNRNGESAVFVLSVYGKEYRRHAA